MHACVMVLENNEALELLLTGPESIARRVARAAAATLPVFERAALGAQVDEAASAATTLAHGRAALLSLRQELLSLSTRGRVEPV